MMSNLKVVLDIDGTLYDSLASIFKTDLSCFDKYHLPHPTIDTYKMAFNTKNWRNMFDALHIPRKIDIREWKLEFSEIYSRAAEPPLIAGVRRLIKSISDAVGYENVYFLTGEGKEKIRARFSRDNLIVASKNLLCDHPDKTKCLIRLARNSRVVYIGDLISDGEACLKANKDANNKIFFIGITHKYAFSHSSLMNKFINLHKDISFEAGCFDRILDILTLIRSKCD